jgi:hypothetical protein
MAREYPHAYLVKVKPKTGKNTRLQYFDEVVDGKPLMQPTKNPKATKSKGAKLFVDLTDEFIDYDDYEAWQTSAIRGYDGRLYYYVMDDTANGKAAKLYVKYQDVEGFFPPQGGVLYTVRKKKESLAEIAEKVFRSNNKRWVNHIYEANKDVIGKKNESIKRGTKLFIPLLAWNQN